MQTHVIVQLKLYNDVNFQFWENFIIEIVIIQILNDEQPWLTTVIICAMAWIMQTSDAILSIGPFTNIELADLE